MTLLVVATDRPELPCPAPARGDRRAVGLYCLGCGRPATAARGTELPGHESGRRNGADSRRRGWAGIGAAGDGFRAGRSRRGALAACAAARNPWTIPTSSRTLIRHVPDFPKPGILFYDITTLLRDRDGLRAALDRLADPFRDAGIDAVVGIESRGFLFGIGVAERLGTGFVPVRKPGKLPARTARVAYDLEYGSDAVEIHEDALAAGQRVLIVDDLLATGGTARATAELVAGRGAAVHALAFLIELGDLGGRERLAGHEVFAALRY